MDSNGKRYYYLELDLQNNIQRIMDTFEEQEGMFTLTFQEYDISRGYRKFNPETREFTEPIPQYYQSEEDIWRSQIEAGMAQIAMQTAKNTLLTGGN